MVKNNSWLAYLLRLGIFLTFIGHGYFAIQAKEEWISYITYFGISLDFAEFILPVIGVLDVITGTLALIYPIRIIILWAFIWAFSTALVRPLSGLEIWDFIERGSNWIVPLSLILIQGLPRNFKDLFKIS